MEQAGLGKGRKAHTRMYRRNRRKKENLQRAEKGERGAKER
jgi:hypothetical protein